MKIRQTKPNIHALEVVKAIDVGESDRVVWNMGLKGGGEALSRDHAPTYKGCWCRPNSEHNKLIAPIFIPSHEQKSSGVMLKQQQGPSACFSRVALSCWFDLLYSHEWFSLVP